MTSKDTAGHLSLANARATEEQHLATTNEQIQEYDLSIKTRQSKIAKYRDAIQAEQDAIADDRREQGKLKRKRLVFRRAAFALDLIEQEG